jgi:hypothetical protein
MIGRPIGGEQTEHLARFIDLHRQTERCAFEEAETTGRADALKVCAGVIALLLVLCLAQFIDTVVF